VFHSDISMAAYPRCVNVPSSLFNFREQEKTANSVLNARRMIDANETTLLLHHRGGIGSMGTGARWELKVE
jgi:hypothetical protein